MTIMAWVIFLFVPVFGNKPKSPFLPPEMASVSSEFVVVTSERGDMEAEGFEKVFGEDFQISLSLFGVDERQRLRDIMNDSHISSVYKAHASSKHEIDLRKVFFKYFRGRKTNVAFFCRVCDAYELVKKEHFFHDGNGEPEAVIFCDGKGNVFVGHEKLLWKGGGISKERLQDSCEVKDEVSWKINLIFLLLPVTVVVFIIVSNRGTATNDELKKKKKGEILERNQRMDQKSTD